MSKGLEVWNAVKKYLNLYHHQAVKENIDVKTVEGMPIDIIEKELIALNIIKEKRVNVAYFIYLFENLQMEDKKALKEYNYSAGSKWAITMEELVILKEVLL